MTGRDILCAIAGIDDGIVLASGQFSAVESSIKDDQKRMRRRFTAIGIAVVICIAVFGAVKSMPQFFKVIISTDTTTIQTPVVIPPTSTPSQTVPTKEAGTTRPGQNDELTSGDPAAVVPSTEREMAQEETSRRQSDAPTHGATPENETEPAAPTSETTDGREAEPAQTTDQPTIPEDKVVFYQLYTYVIVSSTFSDYRLDKVVGEEMVGERLEDAAATGVYVQSDGTILEDETLRCEIFALTCVDPEIAVCVRFIDRGKGLKTDRYYLLHHPDADMSAIESYLNP